MALVSTQHLTEMSTRNISWGGKGGCCVRLTTIPPPCACCHETWEPQRTGALRASPSLYSHCCSFSQLFVTRVKYKYVILKWNTFTINDVSFSMESNLKC